MKLKNPAGFTAIWFCVAAVLPVHCGASASLLAAGDHAVLIAPETNFRLELRQIESEYGNGIRSMPENMHADRFRTSAESELIDLRSALRKDGVDEVRTESIAAALARERAKLEEIDSIRETLRWTNPRNSKPANTPLYVPVEGLPPEFADYLEGAFAWRGSDPEMKRDARASWEKILARPREERRFKSTWAAYMLGKSWMKESPATAIGWFEKTRALADEGFHDTASLAAASLGEQARLELERQDYARAIELYLDQMAAGDRDGAETSLVMVMRELSGKSPETICPLATNLIARRVVTAYMTSTSALRSSIAMFTDPGSTASNWLAAVDKTNPDDPEFAAQLALLAYQNGQWSVTGKWIKRSGHLPISEWLRAKLLLRSGEVRQGYSLLSKLADRIRLEPETDEVRRFDDSLGISLKGRYEIRASEHIQGELGVLAVALGDYSAAIDRFISGSTWIDAAYVAERIMSTDELKAYVERAPGSADDDNSGSGPADRDLRYLLARRLVRENRGNEARQYYPEEWVSEFDQLADALTRGWDESVPAEIRANALFDAARRTRRIGMELIGTELGPDWHLYGGNGQSTLCATIRTNESFKLFPASPDELARDARHRADPEARFHYRYQAAFLGWTAASLLPDNTDFKARILCEAGSWLKSRDPVTADMFYKELVRRCRETIIGDEADRKRWFPDLDDDGNLVSKAESVQFVACGFALNDGQPEPVPTESYTIQRADSVNSIVAALVEMGHPVTVQDLIDANPGLNPSRLRVGQELIIPTPTPSRLDP